MRCACRVVPGARHRTPHAPHRRASQAIEEATGKIYNGKGKDGKKIDKGTTHGQEAPPPGSGRPRRLRHLGARPAALAWPTLPGEEAGPLVTAPLPRALELAASKAADATSPPAVDPAGIAFPTCISPNHCVGHYSPLVSEDDVEIKEGDIVKIDMGVHVDGYIAVVAHTLAPPALPRSAPRGAPQLGMYLAHGAGGRL